MIYAFAAAAAVALGLALMALRVHWAAVVLMAAYVAVHYAAYAELLARPKPAALEWRAADEARLVAATMAEGRAIYLWLALDGAAEPRAYALPWDEAAARALHALQRRAADEGFAIAVRRPFAPSRDRRAPMFHPEPQPALPPKTPE